MSEEPYYYVADSGIHQSGVFASMDIPEGTYIIEYLGEKISKEESQRRGIEWDSYAQEEDIGRVYIFELNEEYDIDGNSDDNVAKLINHSCEENCEAVVDGDSIWITAKRNISAADELTFDYGFDMSHFIDHPCLCGTDNCLGYIVRRDQRQKIRKLLYKKPTSDSAYKALIKEQEENESEETTEA